MSLSSFLQENQPEVGAKHIPTLEVRPASGRGDQSLEGEASNGSTGESFLWESAIG